MSMKGITILKKPIFTKLKVSKGQCGLNGL